MKPERTLPESSWGFLALVGAVVLVAAAWFLFVRTRGDGDPELQRLIARMDAVEQAQAPVDEAGPAAELARSPTGETQEETDAQARERLDRLETAFERDSDDPGSATVEGRLRGIATDKRLLASGIATEGVEVECRARRCRVVADFRDADDASDWAALYTALLGTTPVSGSQAVFVGTVGGGMQLRLFADRGPAAAR